MSATDFPAVLNVKSLMTEVDKMYVANVSFSFSEGNAAFPINREQYKASLLNYRNLTEEDVIRKTFTRI